MDLNSFAALPLLRHNNAPHLFYSPFNMEFLDLPLEIIREILIHAVAVRGIKRGLRLRLVNRKSDLANMWRS